jgi:hypothetical protein
LRQCTGFMVRDDNKRGHDPSPGFVTKRITGAMKVSLL